jgi:hypothetical protein
MVDKISFSSFNLRLLLRVVLVIEFEKVQIIK